LVSSAFYKSYMMQSYQHRCIKFHNLFEVCLGDISNKMNYILKSYYIRSHTPFRRHLLIITIPNRIVHLSNNSHQNYMNDTSFKCVCVFFLLCDSVHLGSTQRSSHTNKEFGPEKNIKYLATKIKSQAVILLVKSPKI
jgi:hypothetical protein